MRKFFYDYHGIVTIRLVLRKRGLFDRFLLRRFECYQAQERNTVDAIVEVGPFDAEVAPSVGGGFSIRQDYVYHCFRYRGLDIVCEYSGFEKGTTRIRVAGGILAGVVYPGEVIDPLLRHVFLSKGCPVVHGAAIASDEGACLLLGDSRVGKTFLALQLAAHGFSFLGDDMIPLKGGIVYSGLTPINFHFHIRDLVPLSPSKRLEIGLKHLLYAATGWRMRLYTPVSVTRLGLPLASHARLEKVFFLQKGEDFVIEKQDNTELFLAQVVEANRAENRLLTRMLEAYRDSVGGSGAEGLWASYADLVRENFREAQHYVVSMPVAPTKRDVARIMELAQA